MLRPWMICIMALVPGCACETVEGSAVKTSGLYALVEAEAIGDGQLTTKTTLTLGPTSLTYIALAADESLVATVGTQNKQMAKRTLFGATWYEAKFSGDTADLPIKVALNRPSDVGAPSSTGTLPGPFAILSPAPGTAFSRSAQGGINLNWEAPSVADPLEVEASGSCIESVSAIRTSPGAADANLPRFTARSGHETETCDVVLTVTKLRDGTIDPAFGKGGAFHARVIRKLTVASTP